MAHPNLNLHLHPYQAWQDLWDRTHDPDGQRQHSDPASLRYASVWAEPYRLYLNLQPVLRSRQLEPDEDRADQIHPVLQCLYVDLQPLADPSAPERVDLQLKDPDHLLQVHSDPGVPAQDDLIRACPDLVCRDPNVPVRGEMELPRHGQREIQGAARPGRGPDEPAQHIMNENTDRGGGLSSRQQQGLVQGVRAGHQAMIRRRKEKSLGA